MVGAFSVITNLRMELFQALVVTLTDQDRARVFAGHKSEQEAEARNGWRRYVQSNLVAGRLQ